MKTFELKKQQFVPRPLGEVFQFFEKPENLATITPQWLGFHILTPSPIRMKEGTVIEYSIRVMGVRRRWKSRISMYNPPHAFADEQLEEPYTFWRHTHGFAEANGGTLITDNIHFKLPFGAMGRLVHALVIRRQLEGIFNHRRQVIEKVFTSQFLSLPKEAGVSV
jgi:ligand-binding SRPBCC domain-containing protein